MPEDAGQRTSFDQGALKPDGEMKEYDEARTGAAKLMREAVAIGAPPKWSPTPWSWLRPQRA
jgi:hypothetical protein